MLHRGMIWSEGQGAEIEALPQAHRIYYSIGQCLGSELQSLLSILQLVEHKPGQPWGHSVC